LGAVSRAGIAGNAGDQSVLTVQAAGIVEGGIHDVLSCIKKVTFSVVVMQLCISWREK
jgi:hypothetical protein